MPKYWGNKFSASGSKEKDGKILQRLQVAQATVTERWP